MVLFGRASFLTGVIAAQSQQRAAKEGASSKIGNVKKKTRPQFLDCDRETNSTDSQLCRGAVLFVSELRNQNCGRVFFFT